MIDSHCHLDHRYFDADREAVLARSVQAGVDGWIIPAVTPTSARAVLNAPWRPTRAWPAVGIHPHDVTENIEEAIAAVATLLETEPEIVAVGECGIDYFYDHAHAEAQTRAFEAQVELAALHDKPLIVHARDGAPRDGSPGRSAYQEILRVLKARPGSVTGVLHSFTGDAETIREAVELGWYIGVGGIATFKQSESLRAALVHAPLDRILLETDAPYLAPVPHRGKRNEPAFLVKTAEAFADLVGIELVDLEAITLENCRRLFRLT